MENYKVMKVLGQGTWGVVHMAEQKGTGRVVAIKKIKSERAEEGVNFTAVREIKLLRELKHENIIELVDIASPRPTWPYVWCTNVPVRISKRFSATRPFRFPWQTTSNTCYLS